MGGKEVGVENGYFFGILAICRYFKASVSKQTIFWGSIKFSVFLGYCKNRGFDLLLN